MSSGPGKQQKTLGLIAGGGKFPLMVAEAAITQGFHVVAVAHRDETDPALSDKVDEIIWIKLGQLGHLIKGLKKHSVGKAVMAGSITKKKMFENVRPDVKGLALMSKLAIFHDDDILRAVADELGKEGIRIISPTVYLPDLQAPAGVLTKRKPGKSERTDIDFGWKIAKELGRLDIGQCVVVKEKTVLALEAIDGTDATILRGGTLAKSGAVVVKVSKPTQDLRFDLPSVGLETVKVMSRVKASALALEAGKTLIFDRPQMIAFANKSHIAVVCL
ncbi:MAG: UDP-2,3-diacylglucosamine diphosphatase LpxI [Deltaproteobacteria bacterium]|nr:UDP-2,3-diacylglucosamine diphosphatase LpxI [Deltaproteobacteria bacterium]MBW1921511.1 UDP-2,3-diacylglucosamine diphosphatase LpxI [Deltaproteobacteria bacterium]MBW1935915.1 UDP-2,3-diacylglucosamine diphosphatase LpxI [Deltaproteobacteria bacterium]MBW1977797.1 UDP-2,3-diacylglucosamine diphosphatase LpxI [Deltaproteobacteria bacterium]MBW2044379.1 UDP-2,3-diacylglucosamine diphosphatase LpxI [Deltaproteobacteria bacterium]